MSRLSLIAFALAGSLSLGACERPPKKDCERVCWKAGELAYWQKVEAKLSAEQDPDEKQVIREEAEEEWAELRAQPVNAELNRCIVTCQKDGRSDDIKCIDDAKDHETVQACFKD